MPRFVITQCIKFRGAPREQVSKSINWTDSEPYQVGCVVLLNFALNFLPVALYVAPCINQIR